MRLYKIGKTTKEIDRKIIIYLQWIKKNPPHVLGHLNGRIDTDRMVALKKEIENREWFKKAGGCLIRRRQKR